MSEDLRAFGYLCPGCGEPVFGARSPFALTASRGSVPCSCGRSALEIDCDGSRFRLTVPCGACGQVHTALCPPERILRGAAALSCPATGRFSCFIGPEGTVEARLGELSLLAPKEGDGDGGGYGESPVLTEVLSELKDIAARPDGIVCRCGSRRYGMEIRPTFVDLTCGECGGKLRIPAATQEDLTQLCCQMRLTIPGGVR